MIPKDLNDTIKVSSWLRKHWEEESTLYILLVIILIGGLYLAFQTDFQTIPQAITLTELAVIAFVMVCLSVGWHVSRKPHVTSKNKIGIAIAISCETKKERQRLKSDFVKSFSDEIRRGNHQHFDVFELSEYHAGQLSSHDKAQYYQKITGAHLIIFGQCRIRMHEGKPTYVLDLHARVLHLTVPVEVSQQLSQDMRQVFPVQALIPESDEVMGFQVTKDIVGIAARFTMGVASFISQDAITAFDFHHSLWLEIKALIEKDADLYPGYKLIGNRLPNLLVLEGLLSARFYFITKRTNYLDEIAKYLDTVQELDPRNYDGHLLKGIYYFLHDHNIDSAKQEIRKAKNDRNSAWQYSAAFLAAYEGDLEEAHKIYRRAFKGNVTPSTPLDVEIFIGDVLEAEPDKIQLWYCLGMINYFCKGDIHAAKKDFLCFIELASKGGRFDTSVKFAQEYLSEIEVKMRN